VSVARQTMFLLLAVVHVDMAGLHRRVTCHETDTHYAHYVLWGITDNRERGECLDLGTIK